MRGMGTWFIKSKLVKDDKTSPAEIIGFVALSLIKRALARVVTYHIENLTPFATLKSVLCVVYSRHMRLCPRC